MPACNRRVFMTRVILGTAAVATAGRALADQNAGTERQESCANCQFYTPAADGATGTCALAGNRVSAAAGCAEFSARAAASGVASP